MSRLVFTFFDTNVFIQAKPAIELQYENKNGAVLGGF